MLSLKANTWLYKYWTCVIWSSGIISWIINRIADILSASYAYAAYHFQMNDSFILKISNFLFQKVKLFSNGLFSTCDANVIYAPWKKKKSNIWKWATIKIHFCCIIAIFPMYFHLFRFQICQQMFNCWYNVVYAVAVHNFAIELLPLFLLLFLYSKMNWYYSVDRIKVHLITLSKSLFRFETVHAQIKWISHRAIQLYSN